MRYLSILVCLFTVFYQCKTYNVPYYGNRSLEDVLQIPQDFDIIRSCADYNVDFTNQDVKYFLYTRKNFAIPIKLTLSNLQELDPSKPTKVIASGWLSRPSDEFIRKVIFAYLNRYDCNVIAIDYIKFMFTTFSRAVCNLRKAAKFVSNFFCKAQVRINLDLDSVHLVGLSLGGQFIGLIGQNVRKTCNSQIGRITGLDPAGPIYQNLDINERLDKSDGKFVDVIHTDMGYFGYFGECGHIDFFPNCGIYQPGCAFLTVICSHIRSIDYFTESIATKFPAFNSTSCASCYTNTSSTECEGDEINPIYAVMGEDCSRPAKNATKFVLETNRRYPYAKG